MWGLFSKIKKNDHITVLLRKLDINGYLPFKTRLLLPTSQLVILSFHVMDLQKLNSSNSLKRLLYNIKTSNGATLIIITHLPRHENQEYDCYKNEARATPPKKQDLFRF